MLHMEETVYDTEPHTHHSNKKQSEQVRRPGPHEGAHKAVLDVENEAESDTLGRSSSTATSAKVFS